MRSYLSRLGKLEVENSRKPDRITLNPFIVHGAITALKVLENGQAISRTDLLEAALIPGSPETTSRDIISVLFSLGAVTALPGGMLRPTAEFLQKRQEERDRRRQEDELRAKELREYFAIQKAAGRYVPDGY